MADQEKKPPTLKDAAESTQSEDEPSTDKSASFMEHALKVSERLLREHKERESKKPKSEK